MEGDGVLPQRVGDRGGAALVVCAVDLGDEARGVPACIEVPASVGALAHDLTIRQWRPASTRVRDEGEFVDGLRPTADVADEPGDDASPQRGCICNVVESRSGVVRRCCTVIASSAPAARSVAAKEAARMAATSSRARIDDLRRDGRLHLVPPRATHVQRLSSERHRSIPAHGRAHVVTLDAALAQLSSADDAARGHGQVSRHLRCTHSLHSHGSSLTRAPRPAPSTPAHPGASPTSR